MDFLTTQQREHSTIWSLAHFAHSCRGQRLFVGMSFEQVFRYIAFCYLDNRINWNGRAGSIEALAITWVDWREHIEARHAEGQNQFKWQRHPKNGDCVFVAEVIGTRASITALWTTVIESAPALMLVPILTYRHGKLVELNLSKIERFCR